MAETQKTRKKAPAAKGRGKKTCTVPGCKRAYRAKGLCFFHHKKWRRGELEGRPSRYDTCHGENCHKKVVARGLCQQHLDAWKASRKGAQAAAAAAAPAAPAAEAPAAS